MLDHQPSDERAFLLRFDPGDRGPIGHEFHEACRLGAKDASQVIAWVRHRAAAMVAAGFTIPSPRNRAQALLDALRDDPMGAREYSQAALQWAALPQAERDRLKAARSDEHRRAHMAGLEVTPKQREYLQALGYGGPQPSS